MAIKKRSRRDNIHHLKELDDIDLPYPGIGTNHQSSSMKTKKKKTELNIEQPFTLTDKQRIIFEQMISVDTRVTILDCLWGTGKTYLSVLAALHLYDKKKIEKIYYVRTPKESSNTASLGYLPGDMDTKMAGYNIVMEEKLSEFLPPDQVKALFDDKIVEYLPPNFIRGRSFRNSVLICDEASNFSWEDILLICSRLGENSRIFLIGDSFQNDIGKKTGFAKFINIFNDEDSRENGVFYFEMKAKEDVVRSGFVRFLMEKLNATSNHHSL
jgi:phosphate starvation-inducible PhoH-like protein